MDIPKPNAGSSQNPMGPLVLECIEKALLRYGSSVSSVILWNFETTCHVSRRDVLRYPEEFVISLAGMFGVGSKIVESAIVSEIRSTLTGMADLASLDLVDVLKEIRANGQRMR